MKNADNVDDVVAKVCHIEGIVHYEFVLHRQLIRFSIKTYYYVWEKDNLQKAPRKMAKLNLVSSSSQCASTFSAVDS